LVEKQILHYEQFVIKCMIKVPYQGTYDWVDIQLE